MSDAAFDDPGMSAEHAEIRIEGGAAVVRDLRQRDRHGAQRPAFLGRRGIEPSRATCSACPIHPRVRALGGPGRGGGGGWPQPELTGASPSIAAIRRSIDAVAPHKRTVVVTGETGTGKEIVARQIDRRSGRAGPFVAVNCGAFTEGLLASELFGHVRGAFTGAVQEQQGLFRSARGGTLLLDDAAEIPLSLQPTLLRVLETWQVRPVGSTRDVDVDVRVVATTNRELLAMVQEKLFRSDLYARLAQWTIRLPPLRQRREDIPALDPKPCSDVATPPAGASRRILQEALLIHDWPMNVRGSTTCCRWRPS